MKAFLRKNRNSLLFILVLFITWRIFLFIPLILGSLILPQRTGYIGPVPWANFDGVHYLSIAEHRYFQFEHAFFPLFPLFPMLIKIFSFVFNNYVLSGIIIVHAALFIALIVFYKLVRFDFTHKTARWTLIFFLFFPTSFFFASIYTESVFVMLVLGSFLAARREKWLLAGIFGVLASATRYAGIFLLPTLIVEFILQKKLRRMPTFAQLQSILQRIWPLLFIPLGLLSYMYYLQVSTGDPFAFVHVQSAFGANRSSDEIILLPQVFYRYIKIFLTVPLTNIDVWIALLEFVSFSSFLFVLLFSIKRIRLSYVIFSLLAILAPTVTGTLSSEPRYIITAFPAFLIFATMGGLRRQLLIGCFILLLTILTMLFLQGYFIA